MGTKLLIQPATGLIGDVPVFPRRIADECNPVFSEHCFNAERLACPSLAPSTMTDRDAFRIGMGDVAYGSAHTAAFVLLRHIDSSSTSSTYDPSISGWGAMLAPR